MVQPYRRCPGVHPGSRNGSWPADIGRVRQHCTQCLTEIFANGKQSPAGETLCASCHSALWGPNVSDEFRGFVALHMGRPIPVGVATKMVR
jgi:hypothetical protein